MTELEQAFSLHRLAGETIPDDLAAILAHREEFAARTGYEMSAEPDWAPWLDTSYLSEEELKEPSLAAAVASGKEICEMISFVAASEDGEYLGYWHGYEGFGVAHAPIVWLSNDGQFCLLGGPRFAEAYLSLQECEGEEYAALRDWFTAIGIAGIAETPPQWQLPVISPSMDELADEFYDRWLKAIQAEAVQ